VTSSDLTPEQLAKIERVSNAFDEDWILDPLKRQIRRKERSLIRNIRDLVWPRHHTVFAMYWWLKYLYLGRFGKAEHGNYLGYTFPLKHDNTPIPGYPMKYELVGNWKIPKHDLRFLTHGPLINKDDGEILVSDKTKWKRLMDKLSTLSQPVKIILWIMGAILTVVSFFGLML